jgi:hypothetical protein
MQYIIVTCTFVLLEMFVTQLILANCIRETATVYFKLQFKKSDLVINYNYIHVYFSRNGEIESEREIINL